MQAVDLLIRLHRGGSANGESAGIGERPGGRDENDVRETAATGSSIEATVERGLIETLHSLEWLTSLLRIVKRVLERMHNQRILGYEQHAEEHGAR